LIPRLRAYPAPPHIPRLRAHPAPPRSSRASALIPRLRAHHVRAITRGRINAPTSLTTGLGVAYRTCDRRAHLRARAPSARRRPEFDSRAFGATHGVEEVALRAASHVLVALVLEVLGERDGLEG